MGGHVKVLFRADAPRSCSTSKRHAAGARRHHREAPALSARRADHRRTGLSRLRDQLLAGRVRARRHAERYCRQDQRRARSHAQRAGGPSAHFARGRRSRSAVRPSIRQPGEERDRPNGPRWSRRPAFSPRTSSRLRCAADDKSPREFRPAPRSATANPVSVATVAIGPALSISSAPADGASACTIRLGNASRPISVA